jgi:hypothetical protein
MSFNLLDRVAINVFALSFSENYFNQNTALSLIFALHATCIKIVYAKQKQKQTEKQLINQNILKVDLQRASERESK